MGIDLKSALLLFGPIVMALGIAVAIVAFGDPNLPVGVDPTTTAATGR
ncbi:hypothetical protein [Mesorhizobium sp. SP-1A]|nr:hypothetical protein [Mesorhizobium sp. SP-1A]